MRSNSPRQPSLALLLRPGVYLKRWLLLMLIGLVALSLGITYLLVDAYRGVAYPVWVTDLTLQFFPLALRAAVMFVIGVGCVAWGLTGLGRSVASAVHGRGGHDGESLLGMIYEYRIRQGGPRIVCIGGGTGMPSVLRGLKSYTANITAVVTVGDDGGSSGRLRREHGILPPGDFRNNIVALAEVEPLMARLLQYRFPGGSALEGHSFGNLFVLAMTGITGNFEQALRETSRVLAVKGTILPSTSEDVTIGACFTDGTSIEGESLIPEEHKHIEHLYLQPEHPAAQPEAVAAILEADLVVLGPGSLYTSVMPNLLVEGIARALQQTEALKVYVCNVAQQAGETDGYDVQSHIDALARHLPGHENPLDVVLVNDTAAAVDGEAARGGDAALVRLSPATAAAAHPRIVVEHVVRDDQPLRHDSERLGEAIMRVFERYGPSSPAKDGDSRP